MNENADSSSFIDVIYFLYTWAQNSDVESTIFIKIEFQYVVKISAPVLVIKMECSNCAAALPSAVTVVQLSGHVIHSILPSVRIGSAVKREETLIKRIYGSNFQPHWCRYY